MGTRNLTLVVQDQQYKIAQYGQWDGYPEGQGATVMQFLLNWNRPVFESKVRALRFITEEEAQAQWVEAGADPGDEWVTFYIADKHTQAHPENSRDTGAGILELVQNGPEGMPIVNNLSFAADSLFCEWAYVIDLDRNTLEVYEGFNKTPLGDAERFYFLQKEGVEYSPVRLVASFSLRALPTWVDFLKACNPPEEEEEVEDEPIPDGLTGMEPALSQNFGLGGVYSKQDIFEYLDELRESAGINMFFAVPYLLKEFTVLIRAEAEVLLQEWMRTFSDRHPNG